MVNAGLAVLDGDRPMRAYARAHRAAHAALLMDARLARVVHLHLARARAAAHADVLECAAKAGVLMALEMGQRDQDIGVHDSRANLGLLNVLAALDRHIGLVRPLESVRNDHMAAGRKGRKAI